MFVKEGHKQPAVLSILKSGDKFLLLKRIKEPHINKYSPVGGKIDPFESPIDATKRETFEETGIRIDNPKYCGVIVESSPTKYNWICFIYLSEIKYLNPPECNEGILEWIEFSKLKDIPTPATDWFIYQYAVQNKNFMFNVEYDAELNIISMSEEIEGLELDMKIVSG